MAECRTQSPGAKLLLRRLMPSPYLPTATITGSSRCVQFFVPCLDDCRLAGLSLSLSLSLFLSLPGAVYKVLGYIPTIRSPREPRQVPQPAVCQTQKSNSPNIMQQRRLSDTGSLSHQAISIQPLGLTQGGADGWRWPWLSKQVQWQSGRAAIPVLHPAGFGLRSQYFAQYKCELLPWFPAISPRTPRFPD